MDVKMDVKKYVKHHIKMDVKMDVQLDLKLVLKLDVHTYFTSYLCYSSSELGYQSPASEPNYVTRHLECLLSEIVR